MGKCKHNSVEVISGCIQKPVDYEHGFGASKINLISNNNQELSYLFMEDNIMSHTIESLEVQIHKLEERDAVGNKNIINKLKRRIRALRNAQNMGRE